MRIGSLLSRLFNSRIFYMLGIFVVFIGVSLENTMRLAYVQLNATKIEMFFTIIPFSIILLLICAFLVVMKRRWADYPAIVLLLLGLILHRPVFWFDYVRPDWSLMKGISEMPFNYLFYPACTALIIFLVVQIKNKRYKIKLS